MNVVGVLKNALMFASGEAAAGTSVEWRLEPGAETSTPKACRTCSSSSSSISS